MKQKKQEGKAAEIAERVPLDPAQNYSIPAGAAAAGVAAITLWRAVNAGHCTTYRAGRRRVVSGAQILAWLEAGGRTGRTTIGGAA